jgi:PAS domain S-box-containing protein
LLKIRAVFGFPRKSRYAPIAIRWKLDVEGNEVRRMKSHHSPRNDSLRESERRLRELIDGLPVAVYTTDADGYLTLYNEAAEAFWGRRPVLGKDRWCGSWKLYDADGTPMQLDRCPLAITLREQRPVRDVEVTAERPDGRRLTFIPHPTPLRDASGKLIGAMNVLVDITERKRAEQALQRQAGLIDLSFDAILVWRQPGGIEFWNKGATLLYGFEKEEAFGKTEHDLLQSRRSVPWEEIEAELRERGFWEGEVRHITKEGKEVFVSSRHQLVAEKDGTMLILETNRDITERKHAEAELNTARQQLVSELANMTRLHEVSMRFVQQGELHGLLDQILDAAIDITGADKGNIQLLDNDGHTLRITTQRGFSRDFLDFFSQVHKGEAACGTVLKRMERVIVEDVMTSPIFVGTPALKVMLSAGCRAVQSTPLLTRAGHLLGIFSTHYGVPWRFTERYLRLLDLLARQAADFIERFQSDEKLRESRQQLAAILESAMDAIISVDANQRIVLFNRAAEKMFRCTASEVIGSSLERFVPARFRAAHNDHIKHFAETGETIREIGKLDTVSGLRADGEEFPIEASISQVLSAGKEFYTVIVRDITRRVREEETLRRQAELLHLSHDAIFVWNAESGIQFWSDGATQVYGYESSEVHGMLPHELFKAGFPSPWPQIEAELHEHGLWEGELHRKNKADREVIVSCRLQLVSDNGKATLILETDRDITERRRLEQELLEICNTEQRRIGQDLHDGLCQHLAGIEFRTSVLIDQLADSPQVQHGIAEIGELIREGARQARMLSHGLAPVSLEADGLMSALKELTENAAKLFSKTCRFECPKPVSVEDNLVATHLYRIAQEAISNAARHSRAKTIVVALRRTAKETTLSITDDGCGFPAPAARSGGMGLRIMKYRAEMIGAVLTIGPAKGGGTSVVCSLRNNR